jgi:uncharacterized membrane protein
LSTHTGHPAWIWLALLAAPLLVLLNLTIIYALVVPACADQNTLPLHVFSVASLLLCLLFTFMAWRQWQQLDTPAVADDDASVRQNFLPAVASISGLLSSLVIAAQWIPQWVLSPCFA